MKIDGFGSCARWRRACSRPFARSERCNTMRTSGAQPLYRGRGGDGPVRRQRSALSRSALRHWPFGCEWVRWLPQAGQPTHISIRAYSRPSSNWAPRQSETVVCLVFFSFSFFARVRIGCIDMNAIRDRGANARGGARGASPLERDVAVHAIVCGRVGIDIEA